MNDQLDRPIEPGQSAHFSDSGLPSLELYEPVLELDDGFDVRAYWDVMLRYKWVILSVIFIAFFSTLIVNMRITPLYKAVGRIEISMEQPRPTKFEETSSQRDPLA